MLKIPQENLYEEVDDGWTTGSNVVCIGCTGAGGELSAAISLQTERVIF
jgi:hypothetical protein